MITVKKHYGKIIMLALFGVPILSIFILFMYMIPLREAQAATYPTTTITLPTYSSGGVLLTNPYFILYDVRTGYLLDATTGVPAAATTWANAAFDSGHWTGGVISTITSFPNLIIPALSSQSVYGILMYDGASPAKTDSCVAKGLFNPQSSLTYSDSVPTKNGEVMTRTSY